MTARRPRRVLHVLNGGAGGAALSTIAIVEHLRADGIDACAISLDSGTAQERERLADAMRGRVLFAPLYLWNRKTRADSWKRPLIHARQIVRTGWMRSSVARVTRFAAEQGADLVHTTTFLTPEGGIAARRLGLPHVWHVRELIGPGKPFRLWREGHRLAAHLAGHCSILVCNSEASSAFFRRLGPSVPIVVVPNGIEVARFAGRGGDGRNGLVVAMVANLTSRSKKHALFVDAAARVGVASHIEFRVYGHDPSAGGTNHGDPYCDELHRRIARQGLSNRFVFAGYVPDPATVMSQVDILVHPADGESFGRVAVEAMAAGLPVVGVRGGGIAEIVKHGVTGLLAAPDDPADLAACIQRLGRDPALRHALGEAGRRRAAESYSAEEAAAAMLRVYERAMERPVRRRSVKSGEGATEPEGVRG